MRQAQTLLYDKARGERQQHATCWCQRGLRFGSVGVMRAPDGSSARFAGLIQCGAIWTCPMCSGHVCNVRREELQRGSLAWHALDPGNRVFLFTGTFPHERETPLAANLAAFTKATKAFKQSRAYRSILSKAARAGSVRGLEVTHGVHGWHPHTHDLVFATAALFPGHMLDAEDRVVHPDAAELRLVWFRCLMKYGLCVSSQRADVLERGLDIRGGDKAAAYIAKFGHDEKWGLASELTMHAAKLGSDAKGAHPFQLLEFAANGDAAAAAQFLEFAAAFKGKRMLTWSPGLKKRLLNEDELTDDEALAVELPAEKKAVQIATLERDAWSVIVARGAFDRFKAFVLTCCTSPETAQAEIDDWITRERTAPRTSRGVIRSPVFGGHGYVDEELEARRHEARNPGSETRAPG